MYIFKNNYLLLLFVLLSCSSEQGIFGTWNVANIDIYVSDEFKHVQDIDPDLLNNKFARLFPQVLREGDAITFDSNGTLKVNSGDAYPFTQSDSLINIKVDDVVYPLKYLVNDGKMFLSRSIFQGEIKWEFDQSE